MSNIIKSIIIKLLYIIIIPIILYDLILIVQSARNKTETPDVFGIKLFTIVSGSMEPRIKINDIVIIKECQDSEIELNDIIAYRVEDRIVTHRVVGIDVQNDESYYITRGDNNNAFDSDKISFNQVEGKFVGVIPRVGKIFVILKNKIVFGVIIVFLGFLYYLDRKKITRQMERKAKRRKFERNNNLKKEEIPN